MRAEDSDASVSLAGTWTASDSSWGWSGASAREVDLFARPTDEIHTPIVTISDLAPGQHKLTIEVTGRQSGEAQGNLVVVDAFDVEPQAVSHWQETDPDAKYSAGWFKSSPAYNWSGSGVSNVPELPVTAEETELPGVKVDLYSPTARYQPVVFTATGLADANHTLTITSTGRRNPTSSAARVVVDAFDVTTPGRRHEEYEPSISYAGMWTPDNDARVWSEGSTATSNVPGATATFTFVGTSVSWIGCEKGSAGGTAKVFIDGSLAGEVRLSENYPIEGYQKTVFRADGLTNGTHTTIEVTNTDGAYVVVDAFDARP